jgi:hypothetical protein
MKAKVRGISIGLLWWRKPNGLLRQSSLLHFIGVSNPRSEFLTTGCIRSDLESELCRVRKLFSQRQQSGLNIVIIGNPKKIVEVEEKSNPDPRGALSVTNFFA